MKVIDQKDLASYLEFAQEQVAAFLSEESAVFAMAKKVDAFIRKTWDDSPPLDPTAMFLLINSYFLMLASLRTAATGHVTAVFPVVRAALESSCYAVHINRHPTLAEVWAKRENGAEAKKKCRKAFNAAVADVTKQLRQEGHASVADMVAEAYEAAITYGAHPNSLSLFKHMAERPDDSSDFWKFDLTCMYDHCSFEGEHAVFSCIEYGLVIAALAIVIHPPHDKTNQLVAEFQQLHDDKEKLITALGWKLRGH